MLAIFALPKRKTEAFDGGTSSLKVGAEEYFNKINFRNNFADWN